MQRRFKTDRALLKLLGVQGGAWTTTDVAIATGMPLDVIEPRLLSLAVASGAQLRVADDGNVTYVFSAQLRRLLLARSWKLRLDACLRKDLPRISDGMVYTTEHDLLTQPIDH